MSRRGCLAEIGWPVAVAALAAPKPGTDAARAASRWRGPMVPFSPAEAARAALVIDAVFGAGLARDVEGIAADTLRAARARGRDRRAERRGRRDRRGARLRARRRRSRSPSSAASPAICCSRAAISAANACSPRSACPRACSTRSRPDSFANGPALWSLPHCGRVRPQILPRPCHRARRRDDRRRAPRRRCRPPCRRRDGDHRRAEPRRCLPHRPRRA